MNRYQKAAIALEWRDENGGTVKEAAKEFDIHRHLLINNLSHLRRARPDLYELVRDGKKSFNQAYKDFAVERDGK